MARLLLENEGFSESRTLQRCARLIARELTAWVMVDTERRHRLRRQFVAGPDDPRLTELTSAVAAVDPPPGSLPCAVHESGHPALIAHAEDAGVLGSDLDGEPLLARLDATSVLSVPLADGETRYGVLTLARRAADGHFKVADLALVAELGEQMALAIRVSRMFRRGSDTVEALHASLLPRRWPDIPGVQIAATYLAATEDPEVGGDFYDLYQTPDGWGLAVGDVCGKGEEATAVTAAARHAIRVLARRCADPGQVLAGANEIVLAEELALDGGFVTANIAHLNWQDDKLRVVLGSAGHPAAAVLRSDGRVLMMSGGGLPLGLFPDAEPATQELTLDDGDVLFLYTDGVAQARGPDNTYFAERLADELAGLADLPPDELVASMRRAMNDFTGGNLVDDVTMLVLRASREDDERAGQRDRRTSPSRRLHGDGMNSEATELWSAALGAAGSVIRYGHWGRPVLVFPSERGRATDFENNGMVGAVEGLIDAGRLKLYCVDSYDAASWSNHDIPLEERARRHGRYESWIVGDVVPWIYRDCGGQSEVITLGCSLGAFHAANFALKRADLFPLAMCFSGSYDPASWNGWGERGNEAYFNNPLDYVGNLAGDHLDWLRGQLSLLLVCGQGQWEDTTGALQSTKRFAALLEDKGIRHELDVWGYDVPHDWPSWRAQLAHHMPRFC